MNFQKVIYENVKKKKIHFTASISTYTGHRHLGVSFNFDLFGIFVIFQVKFTH